MRLVRVLWAWLQIAGGAVAVLAVCWLLAQSVFHLRLLNVQTGSMVPSFRPGDALVMQRVSTAKIGDVVSYRSPRNRNELVTHRVVKTSAGSFQTKGDALASPDPAVHTSLLAGRVVAVLPHMGRALSWIQSWPGLIACVYLPALAVAAEELIRLERRYRSQPYHLALE
jgi:signal peptidase I